MLREFLKKVENPLQEGKIDNTWYPHDSPEGGLPTLGYGHKLTLRENEDQIIYCINILQGCSDKEIDQILEEDIQAARIVAKNCVPEFDELSEDQQDMFIEFAFNLGNGLRQFKKFIKAVVTNDWNTAKEEYKRYYRTSSGQLREVRNRNEQFYEYFLSRHP